MRLAWLFVYQPPDWLLRCAAALVPFRVRVSRCNFSFSGEGARGTDARFAAVAFFRMPDTMRPIVERFDQR